MLPNKEYWVSSSNFFLLVVLSKLHKDTKSDVTLYTLQEYDVTYTQEPPALLAADDKSFGSP